MFRFPEKCAVAVNSKGFCENKTDFLSQKIDKKIAVKNYEFTKEPLPISLNCLGDIPVCFLNAL